MLVNIAEAKAKLSSFIHAVLHGEKVVIAKNNLPLVDLVIHKKSGKRKLGLVSNIEVPDDFNQEHELINQMFYGDTDENID